MVTYGLFRASHSHNPTPIRIIAEPSLRFILIDGRVINLLPLICKHTAGVSFDTVTNIVKKIIIGEKSIL